MINYKEISGFQELNACAELQKKLLGLKGEQIISPLILNVYTRSFPKTGLLIGAFCDNVLIGFILSVAGIERNTLYGVVILVEENYQNKGIGLELFNKTKTIALNYKINSFYGIFDPLEGNLAHLYFSTIGMKGIKYEHGVYELNKNDIPIDKILLKWNFNDRLDINRFSNIEELINLYPICNSEYYPKNEKILVQIPEDYIHLKNKNLKEAMKYRMKTREVFEYYINAHHYIIDSFYSFKTKNQRSNFYLLSKAVSNVE